MSDSPAVSTLRRGVGFHTALATSLGIVVASLTIISLNQGYGLAGYRFTWAVLIAYGIMICNALSFAELSALVTSYLEGEASVEPELVELDAMQLNQLRALGYRFGTPSLK